MKFTLSIAALGLASLSLAQDDPQTVELTFNGDGEPYNMTFLADGEKQCTKNELVVDIIDAPQYNAQSQCTFESADGNEVNTTLSVTDDFRQQLLVDPPTAIAKVSCQGMCVYDLGACYGTDGQMIGPCCSGICAANRCRPWGGV